MVMLMTIRVLIIVENRAAWIDTRVWTEILTLRAQGFEVSVISPRGPKDATRKQSDAEDMSGIHLYTYRLPQCASGILAYLIEYALSMFQTWWLSLFILCKHGFDIIHVANPPDTFFLLGIFYHLFGKRFVFDQHDLAPELFKVKFGERHPILLKILYWLEKRSYDVADLVITTNESQKAFAITRGGCNPEKVVIVRNGPVLEHFSRVSADLSIKNGRPFLLVYVGGMEKQDGIEYTLHAMHELIYIHGRQDVSLALLGNGNALPELEKLRSTLHLEEYVTFTGWANRETVIRYLSTAEIGLCPDPCNGLNEYSTTIKSMEYMALGLPVVAFDLEETRATACEAALYAAPNSSQDFARKIVHLLENPELRALMGQFARARVEAYLSWDHSRPNLLLAYATLLNDSLALALPEQGKASLDGSI
jgi:glycosyltransferase involved in cell wall biosynthesis